MHYTHIKTLYYDLMEAGHAANPRGEETKELNGITMEFAPHTWFLNYDSLPLNYDYVRAELAWYINGRRDDLSIRTKASIWSNCVDANLQIMSNYGYYHHEQSQHVVNVLKADPQSRRGIVNINRPEHNYMGAPDVPCTCYIVYYQREGMLHAHAHMRSQDAVFGLRNDLPAFQMFKLDIADRLGLVPGNLMIFVDSFHVYERHYDTLCELLASDDESTGGRWFETQEQLLRWVYED